MRKLIEICGKVIVAIAFAVTSYGVNTACVYILHQPELPKEAQRFRKF